jgi:hypothetical protein
MCPACQPPPIRDRKLNHDTLAMARVFQQTVSLTEAEKDATSGDQQASDTISDSDFSRGG